MGVTEFIACRLAIPNQPEVIAQDEIRSQQIKLDFDRPARMRHHVDRWGIASTGSTSAIWLRKNRYSSSGNRDICLLNAQMKNAFIPMQLRCQSTRAGIQFMHSFFG